MNNNQGRRRTRRVRQQRKQKNTQISRILLTICMIALVAVVSIGGTIAWLQDTTKTVSNTFTTSDVDITLTETDTNLDGDNDVTTNSYKMVPGDVITKDPKVTVKAGSEPCYVYVQIKKTDLFDTYLTYEMDTSWTKLDGVDGVFYKEVADATQAVELPVIKDNQITVKTTVTNQNMQSFVNGTKPQLTVKAYAIQKANVADAATGWTEVQNLELEYERTTNP